MNFKVFVIPPFLRLLHFLKTDLSQDRYLPAFTVHYPYIVHCVKTNLTIFSFALVLSLLPNMLY